MACRVFRSPRASSDVRGHTIEIAGNSRSAAKRFARAYAKAQTQLADHPFSGMSAEYVAPSLAGLRKLTMPGFVNYLIFYKVDDEVVEIVRVLHGAQDLAAELEARDG